MAHPGQYIHFVGTYTRGGVIINPQKFKVLAGDGAPTVSGGFAKWGVIDRPQRAGVTVLQGYDPFVLTVPIRFEEVTSGNGDIVETDIQKLEWMGGRGKLHLNPDIWTPAYGDSPIVNVTSVDGQGNQTALIPPNCQDIDYVLTGLSYDGNPLRGTDGNRLRQDATVTLTQHVASPGTATDSPSANAKARNNLAGRYTNFKITHGHNTVAKIMSFDVSDSNQKHWATVVADNKAHLHLGGSAHQNLAKIGLVGKLLKVRTEFVKLSRGHRAVHGTS